MHQIIAYIKFLFRSINQHGVHSPFVYDLLTKCLYRKNKSPGCETLSAFIKAIRQDERIIEVKDFGAGSRVFKSNERKVSDIAINAGITQKRAVLLNKLTSYLQINSALELGTSIGISSAAIAAGNEVQLTTLEGCPETAAVAQEYFQKFKLDNINLEVGRFEELLKVEGEKLKEESGEAPQPPKREPDNNQQEIDNWQAVTDTRERRTENLFHTTFTQQQTPNHKPQTRNPQPTTNNQQLSTDLIFFDGNHQKEATLKYFQQLLPLAHNDSVFIFDDIHWSKGMEEAWEKIKAHPQVRVSIDTFYWGIIFFRKEQKKEHFIIRM